MSDTMLTKDKILPCPFCGKQPAMDLGKKTGCQMHGEPMQAVTIQCNWPECVAKPGISAGNIYNGGKAQAQHEAIECWNTRFVSSPAGKQVGQAEGYKLVPLKPTSDMALKGLMAFVHEAGRGREETEEERQKYSPEELENLRSFRMGTQTHNSGEIIAAWKAMLAAAPATPSANPDDAGRENHG